MLPEEEAVVARECDHGVIDIPGFFELGKNASQSLVNRKNHLGAVANTLFRHSRIEDVAEFLKRLQLSVFFAEVTPESTTQVGDAAGSGGAKHVTFNLSAKVVY